jgi:hypothetical protein
MSPDHLRAATAATAATAAGRGQQQQRTAATRRRIQLARPRAVAATSAATAELQSVQRDRRGERVAQPQHRVALPSSAWDSRR